MLDQSAIDLMLSLVAMFVATGKVAMPPGRREDAVALLADLMAAGDRFREYVEPLMAELNSPGRLAEAPGGPGPRDPGEQIAREGFANVPDETWRTSPCRRRPSGRSGSTWTTRRATTSATGTSGRSSPPSGRARRTPRATNGQAGPAGGDWSPRWRLRRILRRCRKRFSPAGYPIRPPLSEAWFASRPTSGTINPACPVHRRHG